MWNMRFENSRRFVHQHCKTGNAGPTWHWPIWQKKSLPLLNYRGINKTSSCLLFIDWTNILINGDQNTVLLPLATMLKQAQQCLMPVAIKTRHDVEDLKPACSIYNMIDLSCKAFKDRVCRFGCDTPYNAL